jgi:glycyl-radical enzyme activating protein family protein
MTGTVFDIKEFTVHDGPGTRVTVFLKGCPLHCQWCHNPEGLSPKPQLMIKKAQCTNCGRCLKPCGHPECLPYGRCLHACPKGLISVSGEEWEASRLASYLRRFRPFFTDGGGITFSGGEPLLQSDFVIEVCGELPDVHKALQTSGYADESVFLKVLTAVDYVLFDLKLADSEAHRFYTGVDNKPIIRNFQLLKQSGKPFVIRIPVIPGITDTRENLLALSEIVGDSPVQLMHYNKLAGAKYAMIGKRFTLPELTETVVDISMFYNATFV